MTVVLAARRQEVGNLAIVRQSADGNVGTVCDSLRLDLRPVDPIETLNKQTSISKRPDSVLTG
jgi:hypothetical protein